MTSLCVCCFCAESIKDDEIPLVITFNSSSDPDSCTQNVYCHPICFKRSMFPGMVCSPILTDGKSRVEINIIINRNNQLITTKVNAIKLHGNKYLIEGNRYRFNKRDLKHCDIWQFRPGDIVECYESNFLKNEKNLTAFRKVESEILNIKKWKKWEESF